MAAPTTEGQSEFTSSQRLTTAEILAQFKQSNPIPGTRPPLENLPNNNTLQPSGNHGSISLQNKSER